MVTESLPTGGEIRPFRIDIPQPDLDDPRDRLSRTRWAPDLPATGWYFKLQSTRPQTVAHALTDSPAGQAAWIVEKFKEWTRPGGKVPEDAVGRDAMLTDVSLYWFTRSGASSAHLYYEMAHDQSGWAPRPRGTVPTGVAVSLSQDVAIRRFAERDHNIVYWSELDRGGHFLALEEPAQFARDVRKFFALLRKK